MSLIALFLYPLYSGYQVRYHNVEDFAGITLWFNISLMFGVLYAIAALAINNLYSLILFLISLVYLSPGVAGIQILKNGMKYDR